MARARTQRVEEVKTRLLARIRDGMYQPGDRFLSAREVAEKFSVSYQTAHRLISELCEQGHLQRVPASGTFLPGRPVKLVGAQLLFHPRGMPAGSFGQHLLSLLQGRLQREGVDCAVTWSGSQKAIRRDRFPVIWEQPEVLRACIESRRNALLLNDHPPVGLDATRVDSVATDDFAGGVSAGQLLQQQTGRQRGFVVLAGPKDDLRSQQRVAGFMSQVATRVVYAGAWTLEAGLSVADEALALRAPGIFCCNDRLAESLVIAAREMQVECPPLVGFDDAPIAEKLNLTTVAIPWNELVAAAVAVVKRRLAGDRSTACRQIFAPRPIVRSLQTR